MKFISLVVMSMFIVSCTSVQKKEVSVKRRLIGTWEGADSTGAVGSFVFFDDGKVKIIADGDELSSNNYQTLLYEVYENLNPVRLDIVMINNMTNRELGRMHFVIKFISNDQMKVRKGSGNEIMDTFEGETPEDTIVLKKIE